MHVAAECWPNCRRILALAVSQLLAWYPCEQAAMKALAREVFVNNSSTVILAKPLPRIGFVQL